MSSVILNLNWDAIVAISAVAAFILSVINFIEHRLSKRLTLSISNAVLLDVVPENPEFFLSFTLANHSPLPFSITSISLMYGPDESLARDELYSTRIASQNPGEIVNVVFSSPLPLAFEPFAAHNVFLSVSHQHIKENLMRSLRAQQSQTDHRSQRVVAKLKVCTSRGVKELKFSIDDFGGKALLLQIGKRKAIYKLL